MGSPILEIDLKRVKNNAVIIRELCVKNGIEPTAVVKGYNAIPAITETIVEAGYKSLGSSRLPHLKLIRERGYSVKTMALRIPMPSEVALVVYYADISLCSEPGTISMLNEEAKRQNRLHGVVLMHDVGDLREGIFDAEVFVETACRVGENYSHLHLEGIGTNLSCYGSVVPTHENLSQLVRCAREIESRLKRQLTIVSGGGSTSLPLLLRENGSEVPEGINHMRIGGAIMLRSEIPDMAVTALPELSDETLVLHAEIIEIGPKPTHPIGVLGRDCFGNKRIYKDRGVRARALLAVGAYDVGDCSKLKALDSRITILGASSDHLIVDINDSERKYKLGDSVAFHLQYQSMLFATGSDFVEKKIV